MSSQFDSFSQPPWELFIHKFHDEFSLFFDFPKMSNTSLSKIDYFNFASESNQFLEEMRLLWWKKGSVSSLFMVHFIRKEMFSRKTESTMLWTNKKRVVNTNQVISYWLRWSYYRMIYTWDKLIITDWLSIDFIAPRQRKKWKRRLRSSCFLRRWHLEGQTLLVRAFSLSLSGRHLHRTLTDSAILQFYLLFMDTWDKLMTRHVWSHNSK